MPSPLKMKYVLVAEDSTDDFLLLRIAFLKAGLPHHLIHLQRGEQAIQYLQGQGPFADRAVHRFPDLLLLDHGMLGAGGLHVLTFIRDHPELHAPPAVILSGSGKELDCRQALQLGAAACFTKPSEFDDLIAIAHAIDQQFLRPDK